MIEILIFSYIFLNTVSFPFTLINDKITPNRFTKDLSIKFILTCILKNININYLFIYIIALELINKYNTFNNYIVFIVFFIDNIRFSRFNTRIGN